MCIRDSSRIALNYLELYKNSCIDLEDSEVLQIFRERQSSYHKAPKRKEKEPFMGKRSFAARLQQLFSAHDMTLGAPWKRCV